MDPCQALERIGTGADRKVFYSSDAGHFHAIITIGSDQRFLFRGKQLG